MTTTYADPNSDSTYTWADDSAPNYERINDGVRSPTNAATGGDGQHCRAGKNDDNEEVIFGCTEPTVSGTVNSVTLYIYAAAGEGPISTDIRVNINGSWQTAATKSVEGGAWYSESWSSGWSAGSFYPLLIGVKPGSISSSDDLLLYAAYVQIEYTEGGGGGDIHEREVQENLALSDAVLLEVLTVFGASIAETIGFSDDPQLAILIGRMLAETIGLSVDGIVATQKVVPLLLVDRIGLSTLLADWELFPVQLRMVIETMALGTSVARSAIGQRRVTETLGLSDSVRRLAVSLRLLSSSMALAATHSQPNTAIVRAIAETIGFTNALTRTLIFHRTLSSIVGLSDDEQHTLLHRRLAADSMGLVDSVTRNVDFFRRVIETVGLSETLNQHNIKRRQVVETIALATQATRNAIYGLAVIEQMGLSDALAKRAILLRRLSESLGAADGVLRQALNLRAVREDVALSTSVQRYQLALRRVTAALGIGDSAGEPEAYSFPDATWKMPKRGRVWHLPERAYSLN